MSRVLLFLVDDKGMARFCRALELTTHPGLLSFLVALFFFSKEILLARFCITTPPCHIAVA